MPRRRIIILWFLLAGMSLHHLQAQPFVDDFEAGILDTWQFISGFAELNDAFFVSPNFSVRLHDGDQDDAASLILRRDFLDNYGTYTVECRADGPVSDIHFLFQYVDPANYYAIACNPRNTDNPEMLLYKVINGDLIEIMQIAPVFDLGQWFTLRVDRRCNGDIDVFVDGSRVIQVNDLSITAAGTIGLGGWGSSTYFDDLRFNPFSCEIINEQEATICSGEGYMFGDRILTQSGTYDDTLQAQNNFDSIIRLELTVALHYLVTERDTICAGASVVFDGDSLATAGNYTASFMTVDGCDSIVELQLMVIGGDQRSIDTILCQGDSLQLGGQLVTGPGVYFDTLWVGSCFDLIEYRVTTPTLMPDLGPDLAICFDDTPEVELNISGFDSVRWSDGSTAANLRITNTGSFSVLVFEQGCSASDSIEIQNACEEDGIYVPNAFSPNGDLVNDVFQPELTQRPAVFQLRIYDRWGGLIFESDNPDQGWHGRVQGQESLPPGVYLYYLRIDTDERAGIVTLIR